MSKPNDRVFFGMCVAAGLVILTGCALPTFDLYLDASVGAGEAQRVYSYHRNLQLLTYAETGGLVFPLAGGALIVVGLAGGIRPRTWLVVAAIALTIPLFVQTVRTIDYAQGTEDGGVYNCDDPRLEDCIGYLAAAVRDQRRDVVSEPIARSPEYNAPERHAFNIHGLAGWQLVGWASALFSLVAWFRGVLLAVPNPRRAAVVYAVVLIVVFVWTVSWSLRDFEP